MNVDTDSVVIIVYQSTLCRITMNAVKLTTGNEWSVKLTTNSECCVTDNSFLACSASLTTTGMLCCETDNGIFFLLVMCKHWVAICKSHQGGVFTGHRPHFWAGNTAMDIQYGKTSAWDFAKVIAEHTHTHTHTHLTESPVTGDPKRVTCHR